MIRAHIRRTLNATTIRKAMVMRFVWLIAFAFLILALALYFLVVVPVARQTASDELAHTADKVEGRVESIVNSTEEIAWISREWVRTGQIKFGDYRGFAQLLIPILHKSVIIEQLYKSAPLHDIGKVGIPDHILLKPGKLVAEEFEVMKTHTTLGRDAILAAEKLIQTPSSFLEVAREIAYSHQEKWGGSGYPQGLSGEQIPISARLMAVADVYDALISARPYKKPFALEVAVELITKGANTHFDPDVVAAFVELADEFRAIAEELRDVAI